MRRPAPTPASLLGVAVLALLCLPARAQGALEGTWSGPLRTGGFVLEVALDLRPEGGGLGGALDVVTQGVYAVPLAVEAVGDSVRAVAPVGGIVVAGRAEGDTLRATWSQPGASVPLVLAREETPDLDAAALDGEWAGSIAILDEPLALRFEGGAGTARVGSREPSPVADLRLRGRRVFFAVPADSARFEGVVLGDEVSGTWAAGGGIYKTDLERAGARADLPYREEAMAVPSRGGVELAGTLTLPEGDGPFPAVVLVSGTGPQDRDESMLNLKPFAVLADALARRGIAVYRYDDRGVGESTGDFMAAGLDDFAADAGAATRALAARPETASVGVVGHSEGAFVAPEVAAETPDVDFVVMLAGAAVPGAQVYAAQHERIVTVGGVEPGAAAVWRRAIEALVGALRASDAPADSLRPALVEAFRDALDGAPPETLDALDMPDPKAVVTTAGTVADFVLQPGIRSFLAYDPGPSLAALEVPALAVFGALDVQIPLEETEAAMRAALADVPGSDVLVLEDQNHLFQTATTGGMEEYTTAGTPMSPAAAEAVADWVLRTTAAGAGGEE